MWKITIERESRLLESRPTPMNFVLPQRKPLIEITLMTCKFIPLIAINDFEFFSFFRRDNKKVKKFEGESRCSFAKLKALSRKWLEKRFST